MVSHVELAWMDPVGKAWYDQLGSFCRVLLFDKAGVGLSDPVPKVRSIDDRAVEIEAVMDAAGFDPRWLWVSVRAVRPRSGSRQSDPIASGACPGRHLCLFEYWLGRHGRQTRKTVSERLCLAMGEAYAPSAEQVGVAGIQPLGGRRARTGDRARRCMS